MIYTSPSPRRAGFLWVFSSSLTFFSFDVISVPCEDQSHYYQIRQIMYLGAYLTALNMVDWGIPEKILRNAVQSRWFWSIGPPSQKLWPNFICARFPHCNYNGGAISKGRRHIWQNAFSDISFYWPKDQESIWGNVNFQNLISVKRSNVHALLRRSLRIMNHE